MLNQFHTDHFIIYMAHRGLIQLGFVNDLDRDIFTGEYMLRQFYHGEMTSAQGLFELV